MVFWVWVLLFTIIIVYSFDSLGYSKLTLLFSAHVEPRSVGGEGKGEKGIREGFGFREGCVCLDFDFLLKDLNHS